MAFIIEFYNPFDDKYYTDRVELEIVVNAYKAVLERRGMTKISVFEE